MIKPELTVVVTDYDWYPEVAEEAEKAMAASREAFLSEMINKPHKYWRVDITTGREWIRSYSPQGEEYERLLKEKGVDISSHVDLSFVNGVQFSPTRRRGMIILGGRDIEYDLIKKAILLQDEDQKSSSSWWTERFPPGLDHIPLVFDYVSNAGYFDERIARLNEDFDVRRVGLFHHFHDWNGLS